MNLRYLTVYHEITKNPLMRILSEMLEKAPEEAEGDASRLVALLVEQSEKYLLEGAGSLGLALSAGRCKCLQHEL